MNLLCYIHVGRPQPVSDVSVTFDTDAGNILFSWSYDDSLNGVPATYFILNITRDNRPNATPLSYPIRANMLSFTVPFESLIGNQTYTASVVVRNLQGDSLSVSDVFRAPGMQYFI